MISYHPAVANAATPWRYDNGFKVADVTDITRIARGITGHVWSGIVWQHGVRREANFQSADWCVFDFDDPGFDLEDALRSFADCIHIIGTTKSHQIWKGEKPPCDRFRVLIPFERTITDLANFRYMMGIMARRYDMDRKCLDGARFFYPCTRIVSLSADGYTQEVKVPPEGYKIPTPIDRTIKHRDQGTFPPWTERQLRTVVPVGVRNTTWWGVAKDLLVLGHDHASVMQIIIESPTYQGQVSDALRREIDGVVSSAERSVANHLKGPKDG